MTLSNEIGQFGQLIKLLLKYDEPNRLITIVGKFQSKVSTSSNSIIARLYYKKAHETIKMLNMQDRADINPKQYK